MFSINKEWPIRTFVPPVFAWTRAHTHTHKHTHTHTHPLRQPGEEERDALLTQTVVKDLIFCGVLFKHLDTCAHILKSERPSTTTLQSC